MSIILNLWWCFKHHFSLPLPVWKDFRLWEGITQCKCMFPSTRAIADSSQLVFKWVLQSTQFPLIAKLLLNWRTLSHLVQSFTHWQALWSHTVSAFSIGREERIPGNSRFHCWLFVQWRKKKHGSKSYVKLCCDIFSLLGWNTYPDGLQKGMSKLTSYALHPFTLFGMEWC